MAIQRWDPLRDLMELQERMKQLFADALSRSAGGGISDATAAGSFRPALDLYEEPGRYVILADLPGVTASEVELQVENGTLFLRGERKPRNDVTREAYLRVERPAGRFMAQIALPSSVDRSAIRATQRNGVIEVLLPKREDPAPSRIEVAPERSSD